MVVVVTLSTSDSTGNNFLNYELCTITLTKMGLPEDMPPVMSVTSPGGYDGTLTWTYSGGTWTAITLIGLIPGNYTVTETVPVGYLNPVFIVSGATPVSSTSNSITFSVAAGDEAVISAMNYEAGTITINKTDAFTGDPLEGSTFELWKLLENPGLTKIDTVVLGPGSGGTHTWTDLPWGHYIVKETIAPPGYLLVPPVDVYIGTGEGESLNWILTTEIADLRILGAITLNKSGLDATATAGFTLYDLVGNPIGAEKTVTGNGSITWSDLPWNTYKIVETTTPAGYTPIADITGIAVDSTHLSYSFDKVNTTITVLGSITLNKSGLDTTDTAGFTLYNSSGNAVGEEKTITGNGSVSWSSLLQDIYKIVETTVPAGYDKMDDITGIVVESGNLNHSFDRVNTKTPPATPPTKKTITKKTTTTTTTPGVIEVLGIQELPFTGMNPAIPISGISTIFAGGLMVILSSIRRKFRRK